MTTLINRGWNSVHGKGQNAEWKWELQWGWEQHKGRKEKGRRERRAMGCHLSCGNSPSCSQIARWETYPLPFVFAGDLCHSFANGSGKKNSYSTRLHAGTRGTRGILGPPAPGIWIKLLASAYRVLLLDTFVHKDLGRSRELSSGAGRKRAEMNVRSSVFRLQDM